MNENDYKWEDGAPMPCAPLEGYPPGGYPVSYIPNTPPPIFRPVPRITEALVTASRQLAVGYSCETALPHIFTSRLCLPFGPVLSSPKTEEEFHEHAKVSFRTAMTIRKIQMVTAVQKALPNWGDCHRRADGDGVDQILSAFEKAAKGVEGLGSFCLIASPARADVLREKVEGFKVYSTYSRSIGKQLYVVCEGTKGHDGKLVWPENLALMVHVSPASLPPIKTLGFSGNPHHTTLRIAFREEMVTEIKDLHDGLQGRIVEDYVVLEPNPEFAFALTW